MPGMNETLEENRLSRLPGNLTACPDCDMLQRMPALPPGGTALCPRCGHSLASSKFNSLERTLALTIAAAIVLIIANVSPLMGLSAVGRHVSTTIIGGAQEMWMQGEGITALLVVFCTVVAPAVHIGFMLTVLLAVRRPPAPAWTGTLLRWSEWHERWAMVEVMMLGVLVALIKIAELATVIPGIGMFAVGALAVLLAGMAVSFDPREAWARVRWANGQLPPSATSSESAIVAEAQ
jgi:paraquat-inducible protein A